MNTAPLFAAASVAFTTAAPSCRTFFSLVYDDDHHPSGIGMTPAVAKTVRLNSSRCRLSRSPRTPRCVARTRRQILQQSSASTNYQTQATKPTKFVPPRLLFIHLFSITKMGNVVLTFCSISKLGYLVLACSLDVQTTNAGLFNDLIPNHTLSSVRSACTGHPLSEDSVRNVGSVRV
jgi:hypothetical protein